MIRDTFLFDLDGTLLPMDFDRFMTLYFTQMGKHFYGKLEPNKLMSAILKATDYMVKTNDGRTNMDQFMTYFDTLIEGNVEDYKPHFDLFYETLFQEVQASTWQNEDIQNAVRLLMKKGYKVVVATNPLFPYRANVHRLQWAGFDVREFAFMTSFEESKYCKPHLEFYQEVLHKIDANASQCYMVGNDVFDDLPSRQLGIQTYLITDCMLNTKQLDIQTDYQGNYKDFYEFVLTLPSLDEGKVKR